MADGRHTGKRWKCYNSPINGPIWTKLGWSYPIIKTPDISAIMYCLVLLEDEHVSKNAANHWQQLLHQQHVSVILAVDFSLNSQLQQTRGW